MKYSLFVILLVAVLITAGCTSENKNVVVTPIQTTQVQTIVVASTPATISPSPILTPYLTQSITPQSTPAKVYDRCEDALSNVKSCSRGVETDKAYCDYWQMRVNASCSATPSITPESISDFKTFSNEEFSIQYPSFLTIDVKKNNPDDYSVNFLSSDNIGYKSISVNHSYTKTHPNIPTLSGWIENWKYGGKSKWYYVEQKSLSIDGIEAYQLIETALLPFWDFQSYKKLHSCSVLKKGSCVCFWSFFESPIW